MRAWDEDEIAWARECATAGDTVEDIAEMADRSVTEVAAVLADLRPMTATERVVASCLAAGMTFSEIDAYRNADSARHAAKRIRAKGYVIPDNKDRLDIDRIRSLAREHGFETLTALGEALGVPVGTRGHWSQRGLPLRRVRAVLHV